MSNKRQGQTAKAAEWAKHLRPYGKSVFWGRQRAGDKVICETNGDAVVKPKRAPRRKAFKIIYRYMCSWGQSSGFSRWMTKAAFSSASKRDRAFDQMVAKASEYFVQEFRKVDP